MNKVSDQRRHSLAWVLLGCALAYVTVAVVAYIGGLSRDLASPPALIAATLVGVGVVVMWSGASHAIYQLTVGVAFGLLVVAGLVSRNGASGHDGVFLSFAAVLSVAGLVHVARDTYDDRRADTHVRGDGALGYMLVTSVMLMAAVVYPEHPEFFGYAVMLAAVIEVATLVLSKRQRSRAVISHA